MQTYTLEQPPVMSSPSTSYESKKHILLIEDNPADARLVELFLEETDLISTKITTRASLAEGIEFVLSGRRVDAVMLDLTLPDSRGFETLENFLTACPDQNVIVMTGLADKSLGLKAVQAGAQDFIVKGTLEPDQLGKSLRYAIERAAVLQRLEETQRIAHIGNWEYNRQTQMFLGSEELFRIFEMKPEKKWLAESHLSIPGIPLAVLKEVHENTLLHGESKMDLEITTKNGEQRFIFLRCRLDSNGHSMYGIIQDISDRRRNEEMRKQHEVAQQSTRMKEQFIASVSHEMRTPMNAILGMSNLVLRSDGLPDEARGFLGSIKSSSEILLGIVNDILEISTLQNGKIEFETRPFSLHEVMANLVNVMNYKISEKALGLELAIHDDVPPVLRGDKLRLNQVLFNLVGNAIKFTDQGHVRIFIKKQEEVGRRVRLLFEVEDSGIGIPQNQLDAIFDSFTRVKHKDRLFEGTGLGLSIARNLVVQQDGKIWAESEVGLGSRFFFTLDFKPGLPGETGTELAILRPGNVMDPKTEFRLLLVEDHKINQIVARKTLEKQFPNIRLTIAENGREAVQLVENQRFDIVLMDIQMPVMDGNEATEYIRKNLSDVAAGLPILAMTAHAHISKDNSFKKFGFDDFVLKPFEPEQLFEKIAEYVFK